MPAPDLDAPQIYERLDPEDIYSRIVGLPEQIIDAWTHGAALRLPEEYREVADHADALVAAEHELAAVVGLLAHVRPRAGHEDETRAVLADRALAVLSGSG